MDLISPGVLAPISYRYWGTAVSAEICDFNSVKLIFPVMFSHAYYRPKNLGHKIERLGILKISLFFCDLWGNLVGYLFMPLFVHVAVVYWKPTRVRGHQEKKAPNTRVQPSYYPSLAFDWQWPFIFHQVFNFSYGMLKIWYYMNGWLLVRLEQADLSWFLFHEKPTRELTVIIMMIMIAIIRI
jgi:hypothetical protein